MEIDIRMCYDYYDICLKRQRNSNKNIMTKYIERGKLI